MFGSKIPTDFGSAKPRLAQKIEVPLDLEQPGSIIFQVVPSGLMKSPFTSMPPFGSVSKQRA